LVIQRDTIQTAKLVASLDQVSGGRFILGIGGGWNAEEMEDHGTVYETRFKKLREQIEAVGGAFRYAARRAIRYGDGMIPQASSAGSGEAEDFLPRLWQMAEEAGRDPKSLSVTLGGAPEDPDRLKRYRDLGVVRMNVRLPPAKADEILPVLDRWAKLIPQLH
jgi:alkanesulfonate monooxygenase SsuD/methylene tetrahydromethanopterin reductase-like flavin-dependent oxidoreductase (luciferase family)